MRTLHIDHNSGFFSCSTVALRKIINDFNEHKSLADVVDRTKQYKNYRIDNDSSIPVYFQETDDIIKYNNEIIFTSAMEEDQFSDYKKLNLSDICPFIKKFFSPSKKVRDIIQNYKNVYGIDYDNFCAVLYRGNDKATETIISSYDEFIIKASQIKENNPHIRFLVQTDELEFLTVFMSHFPDSVYIKELPTITKSQTVMHKIIDKHLLSEFGANFLAATITLSKCKFLVTHSGNCGLWCVLYRGHTENLYQILNDVWLF